MPALAMPLTEMARRATIPAAQLLAETRSALLIVDVQNRFVYGDAANAPTDAQSARVLPPIQQLLSTARSQDVPRFYVTVAHAPGASDSGPWMRRVADMGVDVVGRLSQPPLSEWAQAICDPVKPKPGEIHLTKFRTSAFFETGLDVLLNGAAIETVVMCGVASYGCIIASYIDASSRGFFPLLCPEGIGGNDLALHKTAMDFMGPNSRLSVDEIVAAWSKK
jgi:nicotinamidase-related amidase